MVEVQKPDLAEIVTAVQGIKTQTVTAAEIAQAIKDTLQPVQETDNGDSNKTLERVAEALEKLDFRMKGMGTQAYGGGTVHLAKGTELTANITDFATQTSQAIIQSDITDIKNGISPLASLVTRGATSHALKKVIYAGKAIQGTTGANTGWHITRIWYDADGPVETQYLQGIWNNRAALGWKAPEDASWVSA